MKTSKLATIFILLAGLALIGAFSFPVHAKAGPTSSQQNSGNFVKQPTHTKKHTASKKDTDASTG
jgi:hypothetical protein